MVAEIIPAIIPKDFAELEVKIKLVEPYVKTVQLDVMDGVFVNNVTWPFDLAQGKLSIRELNNLKTDIFLEAHLMTAEPEKAAAEWLASKVGRIIIHYEAATVPSCHSGLDQACPVLDTGESKFNKNGLDSDFRQNDNKRETKSKIFNLIEKTHSANKEFGVALNLGTPIEVLDDFIDKIDLVLLMSVPPGQSGQKFDERVVPKIIALRQKYPDVKIEVDGGVNPQNIAKLIEAGANLLVMGSAIWESENPAKVINQLKEVAKK